MKIAEEIYAYEWTSQRANNCNSYYVGGRTRALIDPGLADFVPSLLEAMEADGIRHDEIRYVISTHSHPDHFEGARVFAAQGTLVGLHPEEVAYLAGGGKLLYDLFGVPRPEIEVNLLLKAGEVDLGEETFQVLHVPGHSPGSVALYWPRRKALFAGDVVFSGNVGRTDFPGGSAARLKESIRLLAGLDVEIFLPGHMEILSGKEAVQENFRQIIDNVLPYLW